jgi:hypothetical protein
MRANYFINEHIIIDERTRVSKKLYYLSEKYREFARYLDLVQKEDVGILLFILLTEEFVYYTRVRDDIKHFNYKKWINYLLVEGFIVETPRIRSEEITSQLQAPKKPLVYELSKKGFDFTQIDYVHQYLMEEFENGENYKDEI